MGSREATLSSFRVVTCFRLLFLPASPLAIFKAAARRPAISGIAWGLRAFLTAAAVVPVPAVTSNPSQPLERGDRRSGLRVRTLHYGTGKPSAYHFP